MDVDPTVVTDRIKPHWKPLAALALGLVLLFPAVSSGIIGGAPELRVAANAPKQAQALNVLLVVSPGLTGSCDGTAKVEVLLDGIIKYPSIYDDLQVEDCRGTLEIPYNKFADQNGIYTVRASFDGMTSEARVYVEKYVNWVFVRAFPDEDNERTRVDVAFDTVQAQPLTSSVFASGTLVLEVRWEECSDDGIVGLPLPNPTEECQAEGDLVFHAEIPIDSEASTHVFIPWDAMDSRKFDDNRPEEGWYNITATFHNVEAKANRNVPQDPSVYQEDPPGNWFEVTYG